MDGKHKAIPLNILQKKWDFRSYVVIGFSFKRNVVLLADIIFSIIIVFKKCFFEQGRGEVRGEESSGARENYVQDILYI